MLSRAKARKDNHMHRWDCGAGWLVLPDDGGTVGCTKPPKSRGVVLNDGQVRRAAQVMAFGSCTSPAG